jgi:hypothetical protein
MRLLRGRKIFKTKSRVRGCQILGIEKIGFTMG